MKRVGVPRGRVRRVLSAIVTVLSCAWVLLFAPSWRGPADAAAEGDGGVCGSKAYPCPMQKWMRVRLGEPMAARDLATVAAGLTASSFLSPDPAWKDWAPISQDGAEAALRGDYAGAKQSCRKCHQLYQDRYRAKFRTRPVPTAR